MQQNFKKFIFFIFPSFISHISHPSDKNREDFFIFLSNQTLKHKQSKGVCPSWTFEFGPFMKVLNLNRISTLFKDLDLPQLMDHLVPVNPQCQTRASDIVKLIILDILSGQQALVHWEQ